MLTPLNMDCTTYTILIKKKSNHRPLDRKYIEQGTLFGQPQDSRIDVFLGRQVVCPGYQHHLSWSEAHRSQKFDRAGRSAGTDLCTSPGNQ